MSEYKESQMSETMRHAEEMKNIKMWLATGAISYDKAKEMAAPHLAAMNEKAREIAKKHGLKPRLIAFATFMR
jgi:Asp-tRNA(Asn)/Glu-tRNA(Gln) amidotransferase B subunit